MTVNADDNKKVQRFIVNVVLREGSEGMVCARACRDGCEWMRGATQDVCVCVGCRQNKRNEDTTSAHARPETTQTKTRERKEEGGGRGRRNQREVKGWEASSFFFLLVVLAGAHLVMSR